MSLPAEINIALYRGDDWDFTGEVVDKNTKQPILDYFDGITTGIIQVKTSRADGAVVSFLSNASEISFNGSQFTLTKGSADTNITPGDYVYDMQCTVGGKTKTLVKGKFTVVDDITYL